MPHGGKHDSKSENGHQVLPNVFYSLFLSQQNFDGSALPNDYWRLSWQYEDWANTLHIIPAKPVFTGHSKIQVDTTSSRTHNITQLKDYMFNLELEALKEIIKITDSIGLEN